MFLDKLKTLYACKEAQDWCADKTWEEAYTSCPRGDWMLWLFARTNRDDLQLLTLAKGHCAATVLHLMKDERSIKAVEVAIAFGENLTTRQELDAAASAAYAVHYAAYAAHYAIDYAAYAAYAASAAYASYANYTAYVASAAHYVADYTAHYAADYAASAAYSVHYAADYASKDDDNTVLIAYQQQTADICRKYLPIELWNI
jgi:hypothetical protein